MIKKKAITFLKKELNKCDEEIQVLVDQINLMWIKFHLYNIIKLSLIMYIIKIKSKDAI